MTVIGSRRRSRVATLWWKAQRKDWPLHLASTYARRNPVVPAAISPLERPEATTVVTMRARDATTGREVEIGVAQRRVSDARLWDSLSADEELAAQRIADAFASLDRGLGVRNVSIENGTGQGGPFKGIAFTNLVDAYFAWGRECTKRRIDHSAIMDVLGYGRSCKATDRARRRQNGYTRDEIAKGLELYLRLYPASGLPETGFRRHGTARP